MSADEFCIECGHRLIAGDCAYCDRFDALLDEMSELTADELLDVAAGTPDMQRRRAAQQLARTQKAAHAEYEERNQ